MVVCFVLFGILIDIALRKVDSANITISKANKILRQNKLELESKSKMLQAVLDGIGDPIYVSDPNTYELLYINSEMEAHWGKGLLGKKCHQVLQGRDEPCSFCSNHIIFKEKPGEVFIWEFQNKINKRWYRCADRSIPWYDGRNVRFEMASDITAEVKMREQLIESEKRFRSILSDISSVAVQGHTMDRRVVYWNKASENLYGYSEEEALGKRLEDLIIPTEKVDDVTHIINDWYIHKKVIPPGELQLRRKDGSSVYVISSFVMIEKDSGEKEMYSIDVDITQNKLAEKKLHEAKEKAETADRLKSRFLANMSHEIRTPMNGILGFMELLKTQELKGEEQQMYIDIIQQSGNRMLDTVNDIITISKLESGHYDISYSDIDVDKEFSDLYCFFRKEAENKGLKLSLNKTDKNEILAHTDRTKLISVVTNLIKNAIKFTDSGSIDIEYGIDDDLLVCRVADTGIGIPEKSRDIIFNRFEQADIKDKYAFQGSGLGLSITKSYLNLLGGDIKFEPRENVTQKGSIFTVQLPLQPCRKGELSVSGLEERMV